MKHVAFYHKVTGTLHQVSVVLSDDSMLEANTPPDHTPIDHPPEGPLDHLSQRVDVATGKVVDYQPPKPSDSHEWRGRRWVLNAVAQAKLNAAAAGRRRCSQLEATQHTLVRQALLAIAGGHPHPAIAALQAIEDEIGTLKADTV